MSATHLDVDCRWTAISTASSRDHDPDPRLDSDADHLATPVPSRLDAGTSIR